MRLFLFFMIAFALFLFAFLPNESNKSKDIENKDIFYIPHPDDEVFFMLGKIMQSENPVLVLLTQGGAGNVDLSEQELKKQRKEEFIQACNHLGIENKYIYDLPDGNLQVDEVYKVIKNKNNKYPNSYHYTMSYFDSHSDHKNSGLALKKAMSNNIVDDAFFFLNCYDDTETYKHKNTTKIKYNKDMLNAKRKVLHYYDLGKDISDTIWYRQYEQPLERYHK